ncbi:VapE domain-containing protein [Terrisporobacter mayombei]|uniref:DNA primase n=1 Tax=Terrisporobacter mayombei TaxID=1541 RepID=A0ABY9Q6M5_9FIRM|nr:VapE domain-containing protein [Terrisporobacter mayombei]MCC3870391.1 hypothetical protein [Terrisporobacter mayombei]WMT83643.1 DNA primase [Terrisporobacter mayombei]
MQEIPNKMEEPILKLVTDESKLIQELYEYGSFKAREKDKYSCMFCPSSDALSIYKKDNHYYYKCFSCGESGDILNLVKTKENLSTFEALKKLADKYQINLDLGTPVKTNRVIKSKVVDFYEKKSEEALKKGDLDEAFRSSCEADRQQENNYYLDFPFLDNKNNPLKVWENVEALLIKLDIKPIYNIITKQIEVLNTDTIDFNNQVMDIHSVCHKHGLKVSIDFLIKAINRIGEKNKHNPVIKYLEQCEFLYDGEAGHIDKLCETLIVPEYFNKELRNNLITKWLLSTVNIAYNEGYSTVEGCLVLQGPQGCGKTSWIKHLVPKEFLKTGLDLDPSNTDSIRKCIKYWVVELGELDSTMKSDQSKLKAFLTESVDEFRVPYAISPVRYNRTTSFFGTVNKSNFLKDETGDRRYWVIPVNDIDVDKLRNLDINQIWGEVMSLLPSNVNNLYLNKEELKALSESNEEFSAKGNTQIMVEASFDWDSNKDTWVFRSTSEIAARLGLKTTTGLKEALESMGAEYTRGRIEGKRQRGYLVPKYYMIIK